ATPLTLRSAVFKDGSGSQIAIKELTHGVFVVNYLSTSENMIYVNETNTGFEDGSQSNPYNTINEGIIHANDGDTVVVCGGIYHEKVEVNKGVFLKGSGAQTTTIEAGSDTEFEDYTIHLNTQHACGISGFTVTNKSYGFIMGVLLLDTPVAVITKNKIIANEMWPGLLISWSNANGGILQGNYLHGGGDCLEIKNSSDLLIQNNRFVSKTVGAYALSGDHSQVTIRGNRFELGSAVVGVRIMNSSEGFIQNNVIESVVQGGRGIEIQEASANIINNTIVTMDAGIRLLNNSSVSVMNNIIVGAKIDNGIYSQGGEAVNSYNNVWNHRFNYNGLSAGIGDISANPLFADSVHRDFHLSSESPCIDAGNPDPAHNDHNGSRNDMGAFGGPLADTSGFLGRQINVAFASSQNFERDTLLIPVTATDVQGINNFEMQIKFNESQLSVLAVRQGELTQAFTLTDSKESPGIIRVNLSSPLDIGKNSGSIYELLARVKNSSDTTIVIRLENLVFRDQIENEYAVAPVEGHFVISSVKDEKTESSILPEKIALYQNYPNPFNPITTIRFDLPKTSRISLKIYNMLGQEIRTLYDGMMIVGAHHVVWDGKDDHGIKMSSGLYFYRLFVEEGQL
ncbi:MAG: right-handed parallel beta-helix repeat-containing protein, partial [bacterium]